MGVNHPRQADLRVLVSTVSRDGHTVLASTVAFDGPKKASGLSASQVAAIQIPGTLDASAVLTQSSDCARFRVSVIDTAAKNTGTFVSFILNRRLSVYPWFHTPDFYKQLLYGGGTSIDVASFYREESRGNFVFSNAGVLGPVTYKGWLNRSDTQHHQDVVLMMQAAGFDFAKYDTNHDGYITDDELELLAFANGALGGQGVNRYPAGCDYISGNSMLRVCSRIVFVPEEIDFETLTHELSHSLGTEDLYGDNTNKGECYSVGLTLMSCTLENPPDSRATIYHDAWHRLKLGWTLVNDPASGWASKDGSSILLSDNAWRSKDGQYSSPVMLMNDKPTGGAAKEYYLFEYRGASGYDQNVSSIGVVVWHVQEDSTGNAWRGQDGSQPPGHAIYAVSSHNPKGGSRAWSADDGHFQLAWADGTVLPYTFWVGPPVGDSATLHWAPAPANNQPPVVTITAPSDMSSGGYGLGNAVHLAATVVDSRGQTVPSAHVDWTGEAAGGTPALIGHGTSAYYTFVRPGSYVITATGYDAYGAHATSKAVHYEALATAPIATIIAPATGAAFYRNQKIKLSGTGSTPSQLQLDCSKLTWTIDLVPKYSHKGCTFFDKFDITGQATITLTVKDPYGQKASTSVPVRFDQPTKATPPIVTITAPTAMRIVNNQTVWVSGEAVDPQGGATTLSWTAFDETSQREVQLSTSGGFNWTPVSSGIWGGGYVDLRLSGTNARGKTSTTSIQLWVDQPAQ
jgi:M6 family metalloprotease-like protein